jgi:hypothetical protein
MRLREALCGIDRKNRGKPLISFNHQLLRYFKKVDTRNINEATVLKMFHSLLNPLVHMLEGVSLVSAPLGKVFTGCQRVLATP